MIAKQQIDCYNTRMYYAIIEIINLEYLKEHDPEKHKTASDIVNDCLLAEGFSWRAGNGPFATYSIDAGNHSRNGGFLNSIINLCGCLSNPELELPGCSAIVMSTREYEASVDRKVHPFFYEIDDLDSAYITTDVLQNIDSVLEVTGDNHLLKLEKQNPQPRRGGNLSRNAFISTICSLGRLDDVIAPLYQEDAPAAILVKNGMAEGVYPSVVEKLKDYTSHKTGHLVLDCTPVYEDDGLTDPFVNSIHRPLFDRVDEYLDGNQKTIWKTQKHLLLKRPPEQSAHVNRFFMVYSLYLQAFAAYMREYQSIPFIVCYTIDSIHKESLAFLFNIISKHKYSGSFFIVAISGPKSKFRFPADFATETIEINVPGKNEIENGITPFTESPETREPFLQYVSTVKRLSAFSLYVMFKEYLDCSDDTEYISSLKSNTAKKQDAIQPVLSYISSLEHPVQYVLLVILKANGLFNVDDIVSVCDAAGLNQQTVRDAINCLERDNVAAANTSGYFYIPVAIDVRWPKKHFGDFADKINRRIIQHIENLKAPRFPIAWYFSVITGNIDDMDSFQLIFKKMSLLLDYDNDELFDYYTGKLKSVLKDLDDAREYEAGIHLLLLRKAFIENDRQKIRDLILNLNQRAASIPDGLKADYFLLSAFYMIYKAEFREGIKKAKDALSLSQSRGCSSGIVASNIEIGNASLALRKFEEASWYYDFALKEARSAGSGIEQAKSVFHVCLIDYINGNYSKALREIEVIETTAAFYENASWTIAIQFLKGRLYFETGMYADSGKTFLNGLSLLEFAPNHEASRLFWRWYARTAVYSGDAAAARHLLEEQLPHHEACFFLSEFWCLQGEMLKAGEYAGEAKRSVPAFVPHSTECFLWDDGFMMLEMKAFSRISARRHFLHLMDVFEAYIACKLDPSDASKEELARLCIDEKIDENDPCNCRYFYWYSDAIPEKNSSAHLTAVNRALKYLQERAARIDKPKTKFAYLNNNYWNKHILERAREVKLV